VCVCVYICLWLLSDSVICASHSHTLSQTLPLSLSLSLFASDDFRIFVGDLGPETTDAMLGDAFKHYGSFAMAKVIRENYTNKHKGYGFVSFLDPFDCGKALREMNGKYCGHRPMKLKKSHWQKRGLVQQAKTGRLLNKRHLKQ
jgi:RNA-binding protein 42